MSITRRIIFRLYPTVAQDKILGYWRRLHKDLYNAAVANRKNQYKHFKKSVDYYEQQNCLPEFKEVWYEYKQLGSHALQATLKRVDMAFQRFFKGLGGYPKFKSIRHYSGWTYPCIAGWKALTNGKNGHLELSAWVHSDRQLSTNWLKQGEYLWKFQPKKLNLAKLVLNAEFKRKKNYLSEFTVAPVD